MNTSDLGFMTAAAIATAIRNALPPRDERKVHEELSGMVISGLFPNPCHQGTSPVGFRDGYRVHRDANTDYGDVGDFPDFRLSDGKIAVKNFLQNFRVGNGKNVPCLDFFQDSIAGAF